MIPLFKPFMPELPEMNSILQSGALAYGVHTRAFEAELQAYFGTPYVIAAGSFASAVSVTLTTLGLVPGDEVIASPMACLVSTQPYLSGGFSIRWCDVDPVRGTLDPQALRRAITPKTKAIIHNHYCGYPGHVDEINAIGREFGIPVIDDGIECFGAEYRGKKIGTSGADAAVFSFSAVRLPNTVEGAAVVFRDREHYEKSLRIRDSGIDRSIFRDEIGEISPLCDIREVGYSATMSNVNGYIGLQQMQHVAQLLERQRENAKIWKQKLASVPGIRILETPEADPNYWVFGLLADRKRETILQFREQGMYASGVHINNNRYSVFGDTKSLPGVEEFYSRFVAIPCGWWVTV